MSGLSGADVCASPGSNELVFGLSLTLPLHHVLVNNTEVLASHNCCESIRFISSTVIALVA